MNFIKFVLFFFILIAINNCDNKISPTSPTEENTDTISPGYGTRKINLNLSKSQIEANVSNVIYKDAGYGEYIVNQCTTAVQFLNEKPVHLLFLSGGIRTSENISLGSTHNEVYKAYGACDSTGYDSKLTYTISFLRRGITFTFNALLKSVIGIGITKSSLILNGPKDTTAEIGKFARFDIIASAKDTSAKGMDDVFQWQKNGVTIPNANSSVYITPPVQASDSGALYRCIVSNSQGSDTSKPAILHVKIAGNAATDTIKIHSIILSEPTDTSVEIGKRASFSIKVPASHSLDKFQWQKNGVDIAGAILMTYITNSVVSSDDGATYRCIVSNPSGSDTSKSAVLHVITTVTNTLDTIYTGYGTDNINLQMNKQQIEAVAQKLQNSNYDEYIFRGCSLSVYYHDELKNVPIAIIYKENVITDKNIQIGSQLDSIVKKYGQPDTIYNSENEYQLRYYKGLLFYFANNSKIVKKIGVYLTLDNVPIPNIIVQPVDVTVTEGQVATFSLTAAGKNLEYQWSINGQHTGPDSNTLSFIPTMENNGDSLWCDVWNMWIMVTESRKVVLHVNPIVPAPQITSQPAKSTVLAGQMAQFTISASGSNVSYQWIRNGNSVGSNANTYSYLTTQYNNNDSIWCIVSNAGGSITSSKALLTVTTNPLTITKQPINVTVTEGNIASFTIAATGNSIRYQWKRNGISVGTNSSTLSFTSLLSYDGNEIWCIVKSSSGDSIISGKAILTVQKKIITGSIKQAYFGDEIDHDQNGAVSMFRIYLQPLIDNNYSVTVHFNIYKRSSSTGSDQAGAWLLLVKYSNVIISGESSGIKRTDIIGNSPTGVYDYKIEMVYSYDGEVLATYELYNHLEEPGLDDTNKSN